MSEAADNPYTNLPDEKFWKTGVRAKQNGSYYDNIWRSKFKIKKKSKIVTAGSCFAQHVGKWLSKRNFDYLPSALDQDHNFSFAFGNIYSTALLRQWLEAATDKADLSEVFYENGGKYYDLLRPAFMSEGFSSKEELLSAREDAIEELREGVSQADVFIFTLGLTESWVDTDGVVYPMCPGTICGEFDPEKHKFKNFDVTENIDELNSAIELAKSLNSNIKFLLTVSPVPLTATASDNHVLTATIKSKSILRTVADALCNENQDVDYFPSYEIITSHANGGRFFKENMRDVTEEGVSYVMSHLEAVVLPYEFKKAMKKQKREADMLSQNMEQMGDAACEEMVLDNVRNPIHSIEPSKYVLIGDSHMGHISKNLKEKDIPHSGGALMNASAWNFGQFHLDDDEYVVLLENKESRNAWLELLDNLKISEMKTGKKPIVFTNVGIQTNYSTNRFGKWIKENFATKKFELKYGPKFFEAEYGDQIQFLKNLVSDSYKVIAISDPPIWKYSDEYRHLEPIKVLYENVISEVYEGIGVKFFNARTWREKGKGFAKDPHIFKDGLPDWVHGSPDYYRELTDALLSRYR